MFAPLVAKTETKEATRSSDKQAHEQSRQEFAGCTAEHILFLQRTIGNQATLRLLSLRTAPAELSPSQAKSPLTVQTRLPWPMQAKLKVGAVDDPLELEADRVAEHVMRMPAPAPVSPSSSDEMLQRKCQSCSEEDKEEEESHEKLSRKESGADTTRDGAFAPPIVQEVLNAPGQPLDPGARAFFEPRFGRDFSQVRVHADAGAAQSARGIHARAYTVGRQIVFGAGQYTPDHKDGRLLIAHELAHVVQQGAAGGPGSATQVALRPNRVGHTIQREEEDAGAPPPPAAPSIARELTDEDEKSCSPLYFQKLCVFIEAGLNGDRSGVPTPEEMKSHNVSCRNESGYPDSEPDVEISDAEKVRLRSPKCDRGEMEAARRKAHSERVSKILDRASKYFLGGAGQEIVALLHDRIFIGSVAVAMTAYIAAWLAPEPVFSKIAAALTTIALLSTGLFSISVIKNIAQAWMDLDSDADSAQTEEEIEQAAQRFGTRIGATEADCLVFLASLLVGGRLPSPKGAPQAAEALAAAERSLAAPKPNGKVIQGPWGRAGIKPAVSEAAPRAMFDGEGNPLKIEFFPKPEPAPASPPPEPLPAPAAAKATAPSAGTGKLPVIPVVPGVKPEPDEQEKKKPPFVLWLPKQKEPHLAGYRSWLGTLQSDPNFERGNPAQLENWHRALRLGGSDPIPASVYERGHALGFTGEDGERRIRVPDWSHSASKSIQMQVDHIIELQLTPAAMREEFDSIFNWELLDAESNQTSGNLLKNSIAAERRKQVAFDPSAANRVLLFDKVELGEGTPGERWGSEEIRAGEQLDAYEQSK